MHAWNLTPTEAIALQKQLAGRLILTGEPEPVRTIAGVDVSFNPRDAEKIVHAAVVVLDYPSLSVIDRQSVTQRVDFPYVPGLLSFREASPILSAFAKLAAKPDLLIVDGQGYAHPRRLGIASHLGLYLDLPAIGCAKSILVGRPANDLPPEAGSRVDLVSNGEVIGSAVRTRTGVQPVYISVGHRLSLASAVRWVLACTRGYRLPEPTREAHKWSNTVRKQMNPP